MNASATQSILEIVGHTVVWASFATAITMIPGTLLAYALARSEFPGKQFISSLTSLPLVLPPTAVGYLLLQLLAINGPLGRHSLGFDLNILLTWKAVVIACSVMSFPLIVRTARVAFEQVDPRLEQMARTLGANKRRTFFRVTLPLARRGLLAATILGFTRAMGEFGATIIIAGNIPGATQTLASAIFSAQQTGNDDQARLLLIIALAVGFAAIFVSEWLATPQKNPSTRPA